MTLDSKGLDPVRSQWTDAEQQHIGQLLSRKLGQDYVSARTGAGGTKVNYIEGSKAIELANKIFGFNGWSSKIVEMSVDYVDETSGRVSLGLSCIIRITLKDGAYREDVGYGSIVNARTKGEAFEKAKKEAVTDAIKRCLRTFGNALGNCLYDKTYNRDLKLHGSSDSFINRDTDLAVAPVPSTSDVIPLVNHNQKSSTEMSENDEFWDGMEADAALVSMISVETAVSQPPVMEIALKPPSLPAQQPLSMLNSMKPPSTDARPPPMPNTGMKRAGPPLQQPADPRRPMPHAHISHQPANAVRSQQFANQQYQPRPPHPQTSQHSFQQQHRP